ncbi:hypothetical protein F5890DRAFT_1502783 [Lentinula detonsa]|uniref:PH domain-containing protein n=1 Tax=Lentinula detonsa TaxID=2804962 RepID=A0AA38UUY1_9AGAR|nr:hypothetical protein F5890DRAFT_1502783 [Lentinula detonsa]
MASTGNRPLSPSMPQQHLSFRLTGNSVGEALNRRTSYKGKERVVEDANGKFFPLSTDFFHSISATEPPSPSLYTFVPRSPSASEMPGGMSAPTSPSSKRSSVLSAASSSSRSSALLEFSPFKFTRKKKPPPSRQNPNLRMNLILPDVLEISAASSLSAPPAGEDVITMEDEETRERVRLREEAAQALGLSTVAHQSHSEDYSDSGHSVASNGTLREEDRTTNTSDQADGNSSHPNDTHHYHPSHLTSTTSLHPPLSNTTTHGRNRSGSMPAAYPSTVPPSIQQNINHAPLPQVNQVPLFPSTPRALASFTQTTSSELLPKYYPSSSLRIFTMTKQWKNRHLILTSPTNVPTSGFNPLPLTLVSENSTSHVSYLHLFKSASPDERELERLEINEDSVVFISEEEIGGKKGVVQVAGVDVGFVLESKKERTSKKDNAREKGRVKGREQAMWLFYITEPSEKQKWIESIKNKVFGQRTIRAGLGPSLPSSNSNEPRGDMDVMMSMRAQAMISQGHTISPTRSTFSVQEYASTGNGDATYPASPTTPTAGSHSVAGHDAASVSSTRSSKKARPSSSHGRNPSGAVLSLKGLFGSKSSVGHSSGRQRSNSRASGIDEWDDFSTSRGARAELTESVVSVGSSKSSIIPKGNNLISILRASSPPNESNTVGFVSNSPGTSLGMGIHTPAVDFAALGIQSSPAQTPQSQLDRKILQRPLVHDDHDGSMTARPLLFSNDTAASPDAVQETTIVSGASARDDKSKSRTLSGGEPFSLQPAPRKRWTSTSDVHSLPVLNTPSSQHLQLQESPFIRDRRDLDDFDVLGGAPSISRINTSGNGSLTPEPLLSSSPATKRTSGHSAYSFSFGTPPGSGNLDVEYRPRSISSRSARSGRSGRSGDTPEDELEEIDVPVSGFDGHSGKTRRTSDGSSGFGTFPDVDRRSSMSSGQRNSVGVIQSKRWSRQLPKRLTPPSGPPPAAPHTPPGSPARSVNKGTHSSPTKSIPKAQPSHPYSGAATEKRASIMTTRSTSSRPSSSHSSVVSNLPAFSKRASMSSAISALSTTSLQASGTTNSVSPSAHVAGNGMTGHSRPTSSHRSSMAPPPRPAPTFALPPAPGESSISPMPTPPMSAPVSSSNHHSSFRDSIASRAFRLSLMAPKPPPSSVLPPRPDEPEHPKSPTSSITSRNTHRKSHSGNHSPLSGGPGSLYSIPGSPVPPSTTDTVTVSRGPLPPTPVSSAPTSPSRGVSIKQRLRILSAPSPTSAPPASPWSSARPTTMMASLAVAAPSPPGTPTFANGLTHYFENSGSFHAVATPTTPSLPVPKIHHVEDELDSEPELTSLSPPPRRSSKRISLPEVEPLLAVHEDRSITTQRTSVENTASNGPNKPFSLSRPASVISFGVVNV